MTHYEIPQEYLLRSAFPRGRMLSQIEDELGVLTQSIVRFTPKEEEDFGEHIDREYSKLRPGVAMKTIRNHRTEMIKLFGLTVVDTNGLVNPSPRTNLLIETQNFPLFFKTFCNRFQFPNAINKPQETAAQLEEGVKFKPAGFILDLFVLGTEKYGSEFSVNGNEISNLVFNDTRVTSGEASVSEVLERLIGLRRQKVQFPGGSRIAQHGREFLGYMYLASLLVKEGNNFMLNRYEQRAIDYIRTNDIFFDVPSNYATDPKLRKKVQHDWGVWFGDVSEDEKEGLATSREEEEIQEVSVSTGRETHTIAKPRREELKEVGDKGELYVLEYEKERIRASRPDKVGLVQRISNDTALGYDIQSLEFDDVSKKKFIEVKTTERTFPPSEGVLTYFPMSGNEWETAKIHGDSYCIYRVFLTKEKIIMFVIKNPAQRETEGSVILEPLKYRVVVTEEAGTYLE